MATNDNIEAKTNELLESVHDRDSFLTFLRQLRDDWENSVAEYRVNPTPIGASSPNGWENSDVGMFLDAALA